MTFLGQLFAYVLGLLENLFYRQESDSPFSGEHWKIYLLSHIREIG